MSMYPVLWAIDHAPVYDAEERAVLVALVIKGDFDGMNCFRSYPTLAAAARVDSKTAGRRCRAMESRGILRRQTKHQSRVWQSIPKEQRPVIWEVMIPAEWWSAAQLESINEQRGSLGRAPLTPKNRPPLAPAPPKAARKDKGVKRPKKTPSTPDPGTHSPRVETDIEREGVGTTSPYPPDYKSLPPGLQVPQPSESPSESPSEINKTPPRPSVPAGSSACEAQADGGTDGRGGGIGVDQEQGRVPAGGDPAAADAAPDKDAATGVGAPAGVSVRRVEMSQGVEVLRRMGRQVPRLKLAGPVLLEQGRQLDGLIASGWTAAELLDVLSAPFDGVIRTSAAAVVAGRIRALPMSPTSAAPWVPTQASSGAVPEPWAGQPPTPPTPTPPAWSERQEEHAQLRRGADTQRCCDGADGMCPSLAVVGEAYCSAHLGWPLCPGGCTRRTPDGLTCPRCVEQMQLLGAEAIEAEPTDDGMCPGQDGVPCGRPVVILGLCPRCRMRAQAERDRVEAEWQAAAAAAAAVAAAAAEEAHTPL
ncbi:hypothetical protein ACIP4W_41005 [Streptomyces sp. NPDC088846]|uniref:hypothetical protein n=1 Tax=Streptomyces sp. NPDC088846 TaxID=3365908 RepID=UPI00381186B5